MNGQRMMPQQAQPNGDFIRRMMQQPMPQSPQQGMPQISQALPQGNPQQSRLAQMLAQYQQRQPQQAMPQPQQYNPSANALLRFR